MNAAGRTLMVGELWDELGTMTNRSTHPITVNGQPVTAVNLTMNGLELEAEDFGPFLPEEVLVFLAEVASGRLTKKEIQARADDLEGKY